MSKATKTASAAAISPGGPSDSLAELVASNKIIIDMEKAKVVRDEAMKEAMDVLSERVLRLTVQFNDANQSVKPSAKKAAKVAVANGDTPSITSAEGYYQYKCSTDVEYRNGENLNEADLKETQKKSLEKFKKLAKDGVQTTEYWKLLAKAKWGTFSLMSVKPGDGRRAQITALFKAWKDAQKVAPEELVEEADASDASDE